MKYLLRTCFTLVIVLLLLTWFSLPVMAQNEKPVLTLDILYGNFNGNVTEGRENIIYFEAGNKGNVLINNIEFTALAPEGWNVTFKPDTINSLSPGRYITVEAVVIPAKSNEKYNSITVIAQSTETRQIMTISTQLETTTGYWMWIGAGIAAVCIAVFIWLFIRLNRSKS
jgi:uncharacterized membrane protein